MARPAKKTPEVLEMILSRISKGDYGKGPLPSTRKLADELSVSKFTILRAFSIAEQRGLLQRGGRNRMVTVAPGRRRKRPMRLACVVPAVDLVSSFHWFLSIDSVAAEKGGAATLVDYRSASDPRLTQALGSDYDVIFLDPPPSPLPSLLIRLLAEKRNSVVPLYADIPEVGLWGVDNMPAVAVDLLVFHMASLGHRRIHLVGGCLLSGDSRRFSIVGRNASQGSKLWAITLHQVAVAKALTCWRPRQTQPAGCWPSIRSQRPLFSATFYRRWEVTALFGERAFIPAKTATSRR